MAVMVTEIDETLRPKGRRFQFGMRTLLLLPVLCALACSWYLQHRHVARAREDHQRIMTQYEGGTASAMEVCETSEALYQAERRSPFADEVHVAARHLLRLQQLESLLRSTAQFGLESDKEHILHLADQVFERRMEATRQLETALGL